MLINYVAVVNRNRDVGIYNKLNAQINAFKAAKMVAKLIRVNSNVHYYFSEKYKDVHIDWKNTRIKDDVDVLYIRYPKANYGFVKFLKNFKCRSGRKIIVEIPTFPYDAEDTNVNLPVIIKDKFFRMFLKQYVDRIVTFSTHKIIFGIKTIQINNGVDFNFVSEREIIETNENEIHLIAVATMKFWHGYDRIIRGLVEYYQNGGERPIYLHMVGTGPEISSYQGLVKTFGINENIIFHGQMTGETLNEVYNLCDIGILSLGGHRINLSYLSELKSREYAAKGLLMVGVQRNDMFSADKYPFMLQYAANDNSLDIKRLVEFYDSIFKRGEKNKRQIVHEIRQSAEKICDIKETMRSVIDYLEKQ